MATEAAGTGAAGTAAARPRSGRRAAAYPRPFWGLLALLITFALVAQLLVTLNITGLPWTTRVIRMLSYFTIQSNILVCVTSWGLAIDPQRRGTLWRVLRLDAVSAIAVTGIIYALFLAGMAKLTGWGLFCDIVFHYVVPIVTVVGWLALGPRGRVDGRICLWALIFPTLWFANTLVHGAASDWYPYHFIDVTKLGYGRSLLNALLVTLLLGAVYVVIWSVDRRVPSLTDDRRRVRRV